MYKEGETIQGGASKKEISMDLPLVYVFLITVNPVPSHLPSKPQISIVINADKDGLESACERAHAILKKKNHGVGGGPPIGDCFTDDWRDLLYDVQEGNQDCFGPLRLFVLA